MFKPPPHSLSSSRQPVSASGLVLKRRRFLSAHNFVSAPIAWTIGKYRYATYRVEQSLKHVGAIMDFMTVQRDGDILAYM